MFKRILEPTGPTPTQVNRDSSLLPLRGMAFLMLAAFLVLAACNREGVESADSGSTNAMPSITIISPHPDDDLTENGLTVEVQVENFIMDIEAIGKAKVPGRGHWHLYLDGELVAPSALMEFDLDAISSGPHHVRAALANNDHSLLLPAVEDSVIIDVKSRLTESLDTPNTYEDAHGRHLPEEDQSLYFINSSDGYSEEGY